MSITFYGAMGLGQISLDHPSGVDWINQRNLDMRVISDLVAVYPFTSMAIPYADAAGKLTQNVNDLMWDSVNKIMRIGPNGTAGSTALSQTMPGLELQVRGMDLTSKYGYGIKFMSADPDFTTHNPKFLAGIFPRATQTYTADTSGGMALDFITMSNSPGASPTLTPSMTLDQNGDLFILARDTGTAAGPSLTLQRNNNATTPSASYLNLQRRDGVNYYLWVDNVGKLRIHTSAPTNATDTAGAIVGLQT